MQIQKGWNQMDRERGARRAMCTCSWKEHRMARYLLYPSPGVSLRIKPSKYIYTPTPTPIPPPPTLSPATGPTCQEGGALALVHLCEVPFTVAFLLFLLFVAASDTIDEALAVVADVVVLA